MQDHFSLKNEPTEVSAPKEISNAMNFWIKREDLHPLGSHKRFGAEAQIQNLIANESAGGVVSTSGNAGICLGSFAKNLGIDVYVLTSDKCESGKLQALAQECEHLFLSKNPARTCNYISAKYGFANLRPSIDDVAIGGFENLGCEIYEQFTGLEGAGKLQEFWSEIYTFVTSGASYIGMFRAFDELKKEGLIKTIPKMHVVTGCADKLGVKNPPRRKEIEKILKSTGGVKIQIDESKLANFKKKFPELSLSEESLSSLAAAMQNGANENSLVISTGKNWKPTAHGDGGFPIPRLDSFEDCDRLFAKLQTK